MPSWKTPVLPASPAKAAIGARVGPGVTAMAAVARAAKAAVVVIAARAVTAMAAAVRVAMAAVSVARVPSVRAAATMTAQRLNSHPPS